MQRTRMVRLTTVPGGFHARVIAARLGAEGIVTELRGNVGGPYPVGEVHVFVDEADLETARELLLADDVESAFDAPPPDAASVTRPHRAFWVVLAAVVAVAAVLVTRLA